MFKQMKVTGLVMDPHSNTPILVLKDVTDETTLPIWIGLLEATAIATELENIQFPRPMTHDLIRDILEELGGRVECIVITELRDRTYFAEVRILLGGQRHIVSSRPSDAVAIAVRVDCPIYAEEELLDAEGVILPEEEEEVEADELVSEFRDFIEGIRPEDFG